MSGGLPLIALEIFLGFGVPLAWAIWELLALRKYRERDREHARAQRAAAQDAGTASAVSPADAACETAASPAPSAGQSDRAADSRASRAPAGPPSAH